MKTGAAAPRVRVVAILRPRSDAEVKGVTFFLFLLAIAAVNIGLGVALALAYDRFEPRLELELGPALGLAADLPADPALEPGSNPLVPPEELPPDGTPPEQWQAVIQELGLEESGRLESALWVLLHHTELLNRKLTEWEQNTRAAAGGPQLESDDWTQEVQRISNELRSVAGHATAEAEHDAALQPLSEALIDYAVQFESGVKSYVGAGSPSETRRPGDRRRDALRRQLDLTFRLRDELEERLAQELSARGRIATTPAPLRLDQRLSLYNRIGLEYLLHLYMQESGYETAQISVALIDIDRFHRVNQQVGIAAADRLLNAFSRILEEGLRQNRGFDRVARIGGQSFVFLLGNTPLSGAEFVAERLRQNIEAASFKVSDIELELTVSGATLTLGAGEPLHVALRRLWAALAEARRAGRNRTCSDSGQELVVVQPKQMQVTGRLVDVRLTD